MKASVRATDIVKQESSRASVTAPIDLGRPTEQKSAPGNAKCVPTARRAWDARKKRPVFDTPFSTQRNLWRELMRFLWIGWILWVRLNHRFGIPPLPS